MSVLCNRVMGNQVTSENQDTLLYTPVSNVCLRSAQLTTFVQILLLPMLLLLEG